MHDVVPAIGAWAVRWIPVIGDDDLDPHLLMWDIHRKVPIDEWPRQRTVLAFRLSSVAPKATSWWLVVADGRADVCDFDPGYDVVGTVSCTLRALTEVWRGDVSWSRAVLDGSVSIDAPSQVRRAVPTWIGQSRLAAVPRLG